VNETPEIGLPTAEDPNARPKMGYALARERVRMGKMRIESPKMAYLIEAISNLARAIQTPNMNEQKLNYFLAKG